MKFDLEKFQSLDLTSNLVKKYEDDLEIIQAILINPASKLKFFGHFYMGLERKLVFVDNSYMSQISTKLQELVSGMVYIEDNTLNIIADPKALNDEFFAFKLLFKIIHEIIHHIFRHNDRIPEDLKSALVFNVAADHTVNSILNDLYKNSKSTNVMHFPKESIFIERYHDKDALESVELLSYKIENNNEFEISAKKIKIPLLPPEIFIQNGLQPPEITVEDILTQKDFSQKLAIEMSAVKKAIETGDVEFLLDDSNSLESAVNNAMITDDDYIKSSNPKFTKSSKAEDFDKNDPDYVDDVNPMIDSIITNSKVTDINAKINIPVDPEAQIETEDEEEYDDTKQSLQQIPEDALPTLTVIIIHVYDKISHKSYESIYDLGNNSSGGKGIGEQAPFVYQNYSQALSSVLNKGTGGGEGGTLFDKFFEVKYPWDYLLKNAIATKTQKSEEKSFATYNKYMGHLMQELSIAIPGTPSKLVPELLCVAIDSSGSMPDEDLNIAVSIICDSHGKYDKIYVFVHDYVVVDTIIIEEATSKDEIFQKIKNIKGRGGTSHREVFEQIQELFENNILSTVMFFTDYESDVEELCGNYEFFKHMETIWCVNGRSDKFQVDIPYPTYTVNISKTK